MSQEVFVRAWRAAGSYDARRASALTWLLTVALAVLGGCTAQEVGRHEDIPLGTAKTRIRTGLRRLREASKEESSDGPPPR
ncbi:sigma factor [Streptomyces sp. NPDC051684]|uniref:sigma factor n=1 Tax=Streptomyces sp. NPDC051684 TaxID=3365670 RepID=UPI0037951F82